MVKVNSLFFEDCKKFIDDQCAVKYDSVIKPISWFSQMLRNGNISANDVSNALSHLEDFLDLKEFEKAEIIAELQLAHAFQNALEEKRTELTELVELK